MELGPADSEELRAAWQAAAEGALKEEKPGRSFDSIPEQDLILVTCRDKGQQVELLQRFHDEGIQVKALISRTSRGGKGTGAFVRSLHLLHLLNFWGSRGILEKRSAPLYPNSCDAMSDVGEKKAATPTGQTPAVKQPGGEPRQEKQIEVFIDGVRVEVSPDLEAAVHRAYQGLLQPLPKEMTTTQAAEFLDVSRPFVIKLIERGELPCRKVGKHRRIPSDSLVQYREKMFHQAKAAAGEISEIAQELGLHDLEGRPPEAR